MRLEKVQYSRQEDIHFTEIVLGTPPAPPGSLLYLSRANQHDANGSWRGSRSYTSHVIEDGGGGVCRGIAALSRPVPSRRGPSRPRTTRQ